MFTATCN